MEHGRIEIRRIWVTSELNDSVKFPHVAQIYRIEREITNKKSGETSIVTTSNLYHKIMPYPCLTSSIGAIDSFIPSDLSTLLTLSNLGLDSPDNISCKLTLFKFESLATLVNPPTSRINNLLDSN